MNGLISLEAEAKKVLLLLDQDFLLAQLHKAVEQEDDVVVFEIKDQLESNRLELIDLGYYQ